MIQKAINNAISSAGIAFAVAKNAAGKSEAEKSAKEAAEKASAKEAKASKKAEAKADIAAVDALKPYAKTAASIQEEEGAGSELQKRSDEISEKASAQRALIEKGGLTAKQASGRKGYITRMTKQQERIQEQLEARKFQAEAMKKRLDALRALHGDAWARMGIDPSKGGNK